MEIIIIFLLGFATTVGAMQVDRALNEPEQKREEWIIKDVQIKPCDKINGITACGKRTDV